MGDENFIEFNIYLLLKSFLNLSPKIKFLPIFLFHLLSCHFSSNFTHQSRNLPWFINTDDPHHWWGATVHQTMKVEKKPSILAILWWCAPQIGFLRFWKKFSLYFFFTTENDDFETTLSLPWTPIASLWYEIIQNHCLHRFFFPVYHLSYQANGNFAQTAIMIISQPDLSHLFYDTCSRDRIISIHVMHLTPVQKSMTHAPLCLFVFLFLRYGYDMILVNMLLYLSMKRHHMIDIPPLREIYDIESATFLFYSCMS